MLHEIDWHARAKAVALPNRPFIDGKYVDSLSGESFACIYPGDGRLLTQVASCNEADVDVAVRSARRAFDSGVWSRMAPADRRRILALLGADPRESRRAGVAGNAECRQADCQCL